MLGVYSQDFSRWWGTGESGVVGVARRRSLLHFKSGFKSNNSCWWTFI